MLRIGRGGRQFLVALAEAGYVVSARDRRFSSKEVGFGEADLLLAI